MRNNTAERYGSVARTLHWLTALLFLFAYITVYYRQWFTEVETPENMSALHLHLSFGVSLGVVTVLRVYWRLTHPAPKEVEAPPLFQMLARAGHFFLYAILIGMPITGYLGTGVATNFFFMFEIPKFADTALFKWAVEDGLGLTFKAFEVPMDFIHKQVGATIVWVMILGHAGAALYHHFLLKDQTLKRMLLPRQCQKSQC